MFLIFLEKINFSHTFFKKLILQWLNLHFYDENVFKFYTLGVIHLLFNPLDHWEGVQIDIMIERAIMEVELRPKKAQKETEKSWKTQSAQNVKHCQNQVEQISLCPPPKQSTLITLEMERRGVSCQLWIVFNKDNKKSGWDVPKRIKASVLMFSQTSCFIRGGESH